jgi:serine/threonine protein kinase/tetratricopeptide (TPR) repeat protein
MQPATTNCPRCEHTVDPRNHFCPKCGAAIGASGSIVVSTGATTLASTVSVPPPSPARAFSRGTPLGQNGRYRIERKLGKGGFGEAYLARDTHLDRPCVVKRLVIKPSWKAHTRELALQNFEREARLLVSLNTPGHPNIPEIYEYLPEHQCLVMKYIEGQSLLQMLKQRSGPSPEEETLRYIRDACSALVYMHSRTPEPVVHRDIKPDNILLDSEGRIWLIDFGLGKATPTKKRQAQARSTQAAGTLGYAPPEQWQGAAEPRSDVYALAATLHTLLTKRQPFDGKADVATLLRGLPPVRQLNPNVRPEIERLMLQALTPEIEARPTAREFLAELDSFLAHPTIPLPPEPDRPPQAADVIGRAAQLAALSQKLARSHLVAITGLAGIGKTTLAALLAQTSAEPAKVFWHSFHQDEGIEVLIWRLAAFLAWHDRDDLWRMLHSTGQSGSQRQPPDVLLDYALHMIDGQDYVLCLDDVQFVDDDPQFAQFVRRLRSDLRSGRVALILTSRHIPAFVRSDHVEALTGLNIGDTQRLLESRNLQLDDTLIADLHRQTDGNPQLLILAIEAMQQSTDPAGLIAHLAEASDIERYLMHEVDERLVEDERAAMGAVAALLGYGGTHDAIAAILDRSNLRRTLHDLSDRSLLTVRDGAMGKEYLQHAIVQDFYYKLLGRRERQAMHRRAGAYYESDEPDPLRAAQHFMRAGEVGQAARLATANVRAGINSGQARALRQLLEQFSAEQLTPEAWIAVVMARGEVYQLLRESALARASYAQALTHLNTFGESPEVRVLKARAYRAMGELLERESPQESLDWLRHGLDELAGADPLEEAILHLRRGSALTALGDYASASRVLEASLRLLPEGPNDWQASALTKLGVIHCSQDDIERGKACFLQALEIYERFGNTLGMIVIRHNLAIEIEIAGDWAGAAAEYRKAIELADRLGSVGHRTNLELSLGILCTKQGDSEAALAHLSRCLELAYDHHLEDAIAASRASLADLWIRLAEWDEAENALTEAEQIARKLQANAQLPEIYREWAQVRLARGAQTAALADAEQSVQLARELDSDLDEGIGLRVLGQALLANDRRDEALAAFRQSLTILDHRDPYEAARTKVQWGDVLRNEDATRTSALFHEAHTTFQALGARHDLEELDAIVQQVGGSR